MTRRRPKATRHLTLSEALRDLFHEEPTENAVRRLRRMIQRKERSLGVVIAIRLGPAPTPLRVTEALLRDHMPELFSRRDTVTTQLREYVDDLREEIQANRKKNNVLAARYRSLRTRFDEHLLGHSLVDT